MITCTLGDKKYTVDFVSGRALREIEWTAIKRTHDGQYQAVADEGENGFTAEKAATFLQSVYAPTFTPEP